MFFAPSHVFDHLWQGGAPPKGSIVKDAGFDVLVLCAEEYQPHPKEFPGVRVVLCPMDDTLLPKKEMLAHAAVAGDFVAKRLASGERVLSTCMMGWNRSGLVSALALRRLLGIDGRQAVRMVKKGRGVQALSNPAFQRFVEGLPAPGRPLVQSA